MHVQGRAVCAASPAADGGVPARRRAGLANSVAAGAEQSRTLWARVVGCSDVLLAGLLGSVTQDWRHLSGPVGSQARVTPASALLRVSRCQLT